MSSPSSTGCSEGGRDPAPPATHTVPPGPDPRRPASPHAVDVSSSQDVEVPVSPAVDLLQPPDVDLSQPQDVNVPAASHLPPLPPDGGYGWVVVFACFCCNGIVEGSVGSFGVFLPHFTEAFSSSRAKTTIAGSLLIGGFLISGAVVSGLINSLGCRLVTMVGGALTVLAFTLSTLSPNLDVFISVYGFVGGFGLAMIYLPAMVMVGYYFEQKRPVATGIAYSGAGIGMLIMAPVSAGLVSAYDWRNALMLLAAFPAQAIVLGALMRPLQPTRLPRRPLARSADAEKGTSRVSEGEPFSKKSPNILANRISEERMLLSTLPAHMMTDASKTQSLTTLAGRSRPHDSTNAAPRDRALLTQSCVDLPSDPFSRRKSLVSHKVLNKHRKKRDQSPFLSCQEILHFPEDIFKQFDLRKLREEVCKPLARRDVFYSGSLYQLPEYRSQPSMGSYRASVTRVSAHDILRSDRVPCSPCAGGCGWVSQMTHLSILTQPHFLTICLASTFIQLGYFIPVVFVSDYALSLGVSQQKAAALISVIGVANTVGRVSAGVLGNVPTVNILHLNNACLFLSGFATLFACNVCKTYPALVVYALLFGLFMGAFVPLTTIFLVKYLGLDRLNNAMGLLSMVRGISSMAGPPIAGALLDSYHSHEPVFYFAGSMFLAAGAAFYILPFCSRKSSDSGSELETESDAPSDDGGQPDQGGTLN